MLINGYGDLENVRKTLAKDGLSSNKKTAAESADVTKTSSLTTDQAEISSSTRMYQMKEKAIAGLEQLPDPRDEKIREALDMLERGGLMTPAIVKESIGRMVDMGILP